MSAIALVYPENNLEKVGECIVPTREVYEADLRMFDEFMLDNLERMGVRRRCLPEYVVISEWFVCTYANREYKTCTKCAERHNHRLKSHTVYVTKRKSCNKHMFTFAKNPDNWCRWCLNTPLCWIDSIYDCNEDGTYEKEKEFKIKLVMCNNCSYIIFPDEYDDWLDEHRTPPSIKKIRYEW